MPVKVLNLTGTQPPLSVGTDRMTYAVRRRWPLLRMASRSGLLCLLTMLSASSTSRVAARRVDDAKDRRGRDRAREDRVGREVVNAFEQG